MRLLPIVPVCRPRCRSSQLHSGNKHGQPENYQEADAVNDGSVCGAPHNPYSAWCNCNCDETTPTPLPVAMQRRWLIHSRYRFFKFWSQWCRLTHTARMQFQSRLGRAPEALCEHCPVIAIFKRSKLPSPCNKASALLRFQKQADGGNRRRILQDTGF